MSAQTTIRSHTRGHLSTRTRIAVAFTVALLTFGVDCCHADHYLAIKATKV